MRPSPSLSLRLAALAAVLLLSVVLAACGSEKAEVEGSGQSHSGEAETEGHYAEVDGLKYQVQVSRQLNPLIRDDRSYIDGLNPDSLTLGTDQVWFAIFMRVENDGEEAHEAAEEFEMHDTQENVFTPVEVPEDNPFSYRPEVLEPGDLLPGGNTPAGERAPNGSVILFKVPRFSLDNRPLELFVEGPDGGEGVINLDV